MHFSWFMKDWVEKQSRYTEKLNRKFNKENWFIYIRLFFPEKENVSSVYMLIEHS